jgi:hypothetical protein
VTYSWRYGGRVEGCGRSPVGPAIKDTQVSPNSRIIHLVIDPYGNLTLRTTDAPSRFDSEDDHHRRDLLKSAKGCEHFHLMQLASVVA